MVVRIWDPRWLTMCAVIREWLPTTWGCGKPFTPTGSESYTGTEARSLLHEEAGYRLTQKQTRRN